MSDYRKILTNALNKKKINEHILYPENMSERIHPKLEEDLISGKHSLGKHPIFPFSDESTFEEKIIGERFNEVVKRYKRSNDVESINNNEAMQNMLPLVFETMGIEAKHKKELADLAIKMIREEYDISEDVVDIIAELTDDININGTIKNASPVTADIVFDNHDEIINANNEVQKRRFINAMIQGAAKKCHHMYYMVDDELTEIDPRLPNKYSKLMATADYLYYVIPNMDDQISGGVVNVTFPTETNPKTVIHAQAMVFPVLIHEIVKGVMEVLSAHGLPKDKKIGEFVINKADYLSAEPWDMRLGPGLWNRFTNMIDPNDFHLKHQIYCELVSLPVNEFNDVMREIIANTKKGKDIIKQLCDTIKKELQEDEYNNAINTSNSDLNTYSFDDLMSEFGNDEDNSSDDDTFNFDDLFE